MTVWIALTVFVAVLAGIALVRRRALSRLPVHGRGNVGAIAESSDHGNPTATDKAGPAFRSSQTEKLTADIYALAFSVKRFDYQILGPHKEILTVAKHAVADIAAQQDYFPRRPAMLPKLLRALNAADSTREDLVRLILQDPVLAGNVLRRANSAFYRQGGVPVESIDRAVVVLGNEGLRAPVATAVLQPVFRLPRGFFDQFAPITWELSQRSAFAAEAYARLTRGGDPFVAHLLGLLGGLGRIVLFRMTLEKYRNHNVMPRAEVFIRVMQEYELTVTRQIATSWELSDDFVAAIDAQIDGRAPAHMSPLALTLYYANLCGALATLSMRNKVSAEDAAQLLGEQSLAAEQFPVLWTAATSDDAV